MLGQNPSGLLCDTCKILAHVVLIFNSFLLYGSFSNALISAV